MNLMDLFRPVKVYTAAEVHAEITAKVIMLMESLKHQVEAVSLPLEVQEEMDLLQRLGFTNSKNLGAIRKVKQQIDDVNAKRRMTAERIQLIQLLHKHYGPKAMLMRLDDFMELLEKYNLSCGFLKNYTGSIPQKNLEEIAKGKAFLDKLDPHDKIRKFWSTEEILTDDIHQRYGIKFEKVTIDYSEVLFLRDNVIRYHGLEEYTNSYARQHPYLHRIPFVELEDCFYPQLQKKDYTASEYSSRLLIAAPVQEMNNAPKLRERIRTEDPFVFSVAKQGVIIYSAWGDEGNDEVMRKYEKLNEWIASCEAFKTLER